MGRPVCLVFSELACGLVVLDLDCLDPVGFDQADFDQAGCEGRFDQADAVGQDCWDFDFAS